MASWIYQLLAASVCERIDLDRVVDVQRMRTDLEAAIAGAFSSKTEPGNPAESLPTDAHH